MSMQENDILLRIQQARTQQPDENPVLTRLRQTRLADVDTRTQIQLQDEQGGFFSSLVRGAAVGALEPLGFLPPVSRFLEAHMGQETPHVGQQIGYALGWIGGTVLPATAALKISALGMRGAGLIKAADTVSDLGMKGNLVRGGIAGALLGAGREAEDPDERVRNIMQEAAFFGIGDAAIHPIMRAISGASLWPRGSRALAKVEEIAEAGMVEGVDGAQIMARAHRVLDTMIPESQALTDLKLGARKTALRLGLSKMGLQDLARGETRIIPALRGDALDIATLLNQVPDIQYRVIKRKIGGVDVADVLVAPKGELDARLVATYKRNLDKHGVGFFPGQMVRWKGADRIVMGATQGRRLETYLPGTGAVPGSKKGIAYVPIDQAVFLPHGAWRSGPSVVPGAAGEWVKFVREFGEFPEVGFDVAFKQTAKRLALDENQSRELYDYFSARLNENLARKDKPLGEVLAKLRAARPGAHPDGDLAELGSQTGYVVGHDVVDRFESVKVSGKKGNIQLVTTVRDVRSGNVMYFATDQDAVAYIRDNPLALPDLTAGIPSPIPHNNLGFQGTAVVPGHTAAEISNARVPWPLLVFGEPLFPRYTFLQRVNDALLEQGIDLPIFATFTKLLERTLLARQQRAPWLERLRGLRTKGIRDEKLSAIRDTLLRPQSSLEEFAKSAGLNEAELTAAKELKTYMRDLIQDMNKVTKLAIEPDEFLEEYLPYIITSEPGEWQKKLATSLSARGKKVNGRMIKFAEEMERAGINPGRLENNPFMVALRWTTTAFTKRHVDEAFFEARDLLEKLPTEGVGGVLRRSLEGGIKAAYGGTAEAYYVARVAADGYFQNLGIKLESKDFDRLISSLISMNHGAFMGFHPAKAVRNLTQMVAVTLPLIQSPKHFAHGLKVGFTKAGRDEAMDALAIAVDSIAAPFEDQITRDALFSRLAKATGRVGENGKPTGLGDRLVARALQVTTKGADLAHVGLSGSVKVGGVEIPTGLYGRADYATRAVAYHAQKSKTLEALREWGMGSGAGHGSLKRFNAEAGLDMLGPSITQEFHRKLSHEGTDAAVRWVSTQLSNETNWVYQTGAGPSLFSQGAGRLFGMYGTWPSWYAAHLIRGATRGSAVDKARFWGWTGAVVAAVPAASYATQINLDQWSPLSALTWTGGPAVDWFNDWRSIVSGAAPPGEQPTAARAIALSSRGLQDSPDRTPIPFLGHLDPRKGQGLDVKPGEEYKMATDLLQLFTPGASQIRSILRAPQEATPRAAILRAAGFDPIAGHAWPRIQVP